MLYFDTDKQPPRVDKCTSPDPFIKSHHRGGPLIVEWEEPLFSDNSQEPVEIRATHKVGEHFGLGLTQVVYTAIDKSGNNATCVIMIIVKGKSLHGILASFCVHQF